MANFLPATYVHNWCLSKYILSISIIIVIKCLFLTVILLTENLYGNNGCLIIQLNLIIMGASASCLWYDSTCLCEQLSVASSSSSLIHFSDIGVAPPRLVMPQAFCQWRDQFRGSNSDADKVDQTWSRHLVGNQSQTSVNDETLASSHRFKIVIGLVFERLCKKRIWLLTTM